MRNVMLMAVFGLFLSGCASHNFLRVDGAGSPVQGPKTIEAVNLVTALNPSGHYPKSANDCLTEGKPPSGCGHYASTSLATTLFTLMGLDKASSAEGDKALIKERIRLEGAFAAFYSSENDPYGTPAARRDRLQNRLIMASDQNCTTFAQTLYGVQASTNFVLGSLATGLAGSGAITTNQQTARLLSGLSGIATGIRSEANEDFFRKQWVEAILKAIETSRNKMKTDMQASAAQSIIVYPVEAAIADAIRYNAACSLVAGMKEVNSAVSMADDPAGVRAFRDAFKQAGYKVEFNLERKETPEPDDALSLEGASLRDRRDTAGKGQDAFLELDQAVRRMHANIPYLVKKNIDAADDGKKKEAETEIRSALDRLATAFGADVAPHQAKLQTQASTALELNKELVATSDVTKREDKQAEILANDRQAAAELELALHIVKRTEEQMEKQAQELRTGKGQKQP